MDNIINVKDFIGNVPADTLVTAAVQQAIDACAAAGGGCVTFPEGEYVLGTVFLRSHVKVEITPKARVLGALSLLDYEPDEPRDCPLYQDISHSFFHLSMFVGEELEDIELCGGGTVDMRSVWCDDGHRGPNENRGAKSVALRCCNNVAIHDLTFLNATDLAVYFAGCEHVEICRLNMRVHIDGISPDCCRDVKIHDCDLICGDDGIVPKASYTLEKLVACEDLDIRDCRVSSRCNAVKFGTETNGDFRNVLVENIEIYNTRLSGIAVESVDGANFRNITFRNIRMKNVFAPIFVCIGNRMRGPAGMEIGSINGVLFENITAEGPYDEYEMIPHSFVAFKTDDVVVKPWHLMGTATRPGSTWDTLEKDDNWQTTSAISGMEGHPVENITFRNVSLTMHGGAKTTVDAVPEIANNYPEIIRYGTKLPAKGLYFRFVNGLTLENVHVDTVLPDVRRDFVFDDVQGLEQR